VDLGRLLTLSVALACALGACTKKASEAEPRENGPLSVAAVNYPLAYFAERLAQADANVALPVPAGVDPAHWQPTANDIATFQEADVVLLNGAGYAAWTRTASLPKARSVVTAKGCRERFLPSEATGTHRHGPEGEHSHRGTAFTTWLDLRLATCQAAAVRDAIKKARPEDQGVDARFASLEGDLGELDAALRKATEPLRSQAVFASHPVYQYLGDAYGLDIHSFHFEPDEALEDEALATLDSARKTHRASVMLWEGEPAAATRAALEERGIGIVVFETASNRPSGGDFLTVMRDNVERLRCAANVEGCR
jgi:zinc transport system substrate-binding protein